MSNSCLVCHIFCKIYQKVMMDFVTGCIYFTVGLLRRGLLLSSTVLLNTDIVLMYLAVI